MPQPPYLGEFEQQVLLVVVRLRDEAFGPDIGRELEARAGRRVSRGALYTTFDRLEDKGLLSSRLIEAPTVRGGTKRLFRATASGVKAVKHALATIEGLRKGLEPLLGDR